MNRIRKWLMGPVGFAKYMSKFQIETDTPTEKVARTLWFAQLSSKGDVPIRQAGYSIEHDNLVLMIEDDYYSVTVERIDVCQD